jgi:hypothetical protein
MPRKVGPIPKCGLSSLMCIPSNVRCRVPTRVEPRLACRTNFWRPHSFGMAISLRSIISEQQARKFQEDDDGKYARTTAREDAEYEAMLAQVLAASIADVPEDVLEAIRAMDSSEKDVDGGVTVITGKDIESDGVPPSETGPVATSDVDPGVLAVHIGFSWPFYSRIVGYADFAIALALQEEEDRALAKSQGSSRIGGGPSRYDGDYHSRLRQDERYHAGKEDFAVSSADWAGKPKGKQPKGTAPTKHDPVICGRQNAKYLERVKGFSVLVFASCLILACGLVVVAALRR